MNKRFLGVLIFAFVVASLASLLLYRLLVNRPQATNAAVPVQQIIVAAKDISIGSVLTEKDVKLADWPGLVPTGATGKMQDVLGRGVTTPVYEKEPLIESRLAPKGAGGGLASMIPPGMRAVAVHVNEVAGVAGFVVAGMHVDILIMGNSPVGDRGLGTVTKTLLQNVEVLSAGQEFKKDAEGKPISVGVVNLLVTPEQAERLSLAENSTSLQLVLRNPLDHEVTKTPGTAVALLFQGGTLGEQNPIASPAAAPRPRAATPVARAAEIEPVAPPLPPKKDPGFTMEIISGTHKVEAKFETPGEGK